MSQVFHDGAPLAFDPVPRAASQTLDRIVNAALACVPGFSYAGISMIHRDGWIDTVAATDRMVWEIDALQFAFDEGPCLSALREDIVVVAPDLAFDTRWSQYGVEAAQRNGLKSQLVLQVFVDDGILCALSFYSTKYSVIHPDAPQMAEKFANHAALAMGRAAPFDEPVRVNGKTRRLLPD